MFSVLFLRDSNLSAFTAFCWHVSQILTDHNIIISPFLWLLDSKSDSQESSGCDHGATIDFYFLNIFKLNILRDFSRCVRAGRSALTSQSSTWKFHANVPDIRKIQKNLQSRLRALRKDPTKLETPISQKVTLQKHRGIRTRSFQHPSAGHKRPKKSEGLPATA